jgi:F0F1-type ATP synthase membrane subunit c/vacuolar-type H+-ATPase subunit K
VAKRPDEMGKGMIFAIVVETYAVLGLLGTILLLQNIGA